MLPLIGGDAAATADPSRCPPRDAQGRVAITPQVLVALDRCLALEPQTRSLHWRGAGYTPGRQALHRAILERSTAGRSCVSRRAPIALSPAMLRVDADEIRAQLPEYRGWNAMSTQQETGDIVDRLLASIGSPCRTDLVFDGTLTHARRYLALIPRLHALG